MTTVKTASFGEIDDDNFWKVEQTILELSKINARFKYSGIPYSIKTELTNIESLKDNEKEFYKYMLKHLNPYVEGVVYETKPRSQEEIEIGRRVLRNSMT
jgi:hypothetical protein